MREARDGIFTSEDTDLEIRRLFKEAQHLDWEPTKSHRFNVTIPPTVYPPREDTDLFAKRLILLGPGKGRKFLEIGCGTGALSILASSLGWKVSACDVNPYAVAASRGNLEANLQQGYVKEGGVGPETFPFKDKFDLIIWNLPYIPVNEIDTVLGPMEEAALVDTDNQGLAKRLLDCVNKNHLLATGGRILILGRANSIHSQDGFAARKWDELNFENGEQLQIVCLWRPYEKSTKKYVEKTGSTNDDLLSSNEEVGTHISTSWQDLGRGRRDRTWTSIDGCYAGSWVVAKSNEINPGLLQLSGGLAVLKSININQLNLKWPNDILLDGRKLCGILVEGRTTSNFTTAVLGIGINLNPSKEIQDFEMASLDEITDLDFDEIDSKLHCNIASLLEVGEYLPPVDFQAIKKDILLQMQKFGKPTYQGVTYDSFDLTDIGELILGNQIVDDGEKVEWN